MNKVMIYWTLALLVTNGLSFWAGRMGSEVVSQDSDQLEVSVPSKSQVRDFCSLAYVDETESDLITKVQIKDVFGVWDEVNSSILCAVDSIHYVEGAGGDYLELDRVGYFTLRHGNKLTKVTKAFFLSEIKGK